MSPSSIAKSLVVATALALSVRAETVPVPHTGFENDYAYIEWVADSIEFTARQQVIAGSDLVVPPFTGQYSWRSSGEKPREHYVFREPNLKTPGGHREGTNVKAEFDADVLCDVGRNTYKIEFTYDRVRDQYDKEGDHATRVIRSLKYALAVERLSPEEQAKAAAVEKANADAMAALVDAYKPRVVAVAPGYPGAHGSEATLQFVSQVMSGMRSFAEPFVVQLAHAKDLGSDSNDENGEVFFTLADVSRFNTVLPRWNDWRQKAHDNAIRSVDKTLFEWKSEPGTADANSKYQFHVDEAGKCWLKIFGEGVGQRFALFLVEDEVPGFGTALNDLAGDPQRIIAGINDQIAQTETKAQKANELFK